MVVAAFVVAAVALVPPGAGAASQTRREFRSALSKGSVLAPKLVGTIRGGIARPSFRAPGFDVSSLTRPPPLLTPNPIEYVALKQRSGESSNVELRAIAPPSAAGNAATESFVGGVAFAGISQRSEVAAFGRSQYVSPPDVQLAAGPSQLVEGANTTVSVWDKSGHPIAIYDLASFMGLPRGSYMSDPWVLYDTMSGRWFVSCFAIDANKNSTVFFAASDTSDPTETWQVYFMGPTVRIITDQPRIGVTLDKIVLSWDDYGVGSGFMGNEVWVIQKSDVLAGSTSPGNFFFEADPTYFSVMPARLLASTATAYLVYTNSNPDQLQSLAYPSIGVAAVTGSPAAGNVTWSESDPQVTSTAFPPQASQAYGYPLDTGDTRMTSAVWANNVLWTAGNDACTPEGGSRRRSCIRVTALGTGSPEATVLDEYDVSGEGIDAAYGALTLTSAGEMHMVSAASGPGFYPSVFSTGQSAPQGDFLPTTWVATGQGPLDNYQKSFQANRWGDYSGASTDPSDPTTVWLASEFAATGTTPSNWGTVIAQGGAALGPDRISPSITKVDDSPDPFYPNGDGRKDVTRIQWRLNEGSVFTLMITAKGSSRPVVRIATYTTTGQWVYTWNGRTSGRKPAPAGHYIYRLIATDASGNRSKETKGSVTLLR